ncbi:MAG: hypothetical protein ACXAC6_08545 [Candidatus Hodarchaeales archaeon]|jgi:hypothetical protein
MSKLTKMKYSLIVVVFVALMGFSTIAINASTAPIVPIGEMEDKYTPSTNGDWDYYVLPPDTDFSGVIYGGGSAPSSDTRYTDVLTNGFTYYNSELNRGDPPSNNLLRSDTRTAPHPLFDNVLYPRAVRIAAERNPEFIQTQKSVISLHNDYSTTFFAEGGEFYTGFFNTSEPFFMDVEVSNNRVMGGLIFDSAFPETGYSFGDPETRMTYPVIPNAPGLQEFAILTNVSTLITLTPHEWKYPTWFPSLEQNTIFSEEFDQGDVWSKDEDNDQLVQPDNEMFSLRLFNFSVEEDHYYRINTAFVMDEVQPGVLSAPPMTSLLGTDFEVISGDLEDEGLVIKALNTVEITIIMFSPGEAHGTYSLFYQETPALSVAETRPLTFDEDLALEQEIYYTFTLSNPIVIRVNITGSYNYDLYVEGSEPGDWIFKTNEGFIDGNWRYLPAGTYMLEAFPNNPGDEIRFNSVSIRSPSMLSVNEEGIFAIELPLLKNRINFVNVSTEDHANQSIDYSWEIISKYDEFVDDTDSGSLTLGNEQTNGVWIGNPINQSNILEYFPGREHEVPILLIYPTGADNLTDPISTFGGSLIVSVGEAPDQSYAAKSFYTEYSAFSGSNFVGTFIPKPAISSTTSYTINSDDTTDNDQIIGIPLNLAANKIFNLTLTLTGNYSTTTSLNVTFHNGYPFRALGGDLRSLNIFSTYTSGSDNLKAWQTGLILTVSGTSYLYMDLRRNGAPYNGTLQVRVTDIGATNMVFQINQEYNETISDYEVKSTSLLVKKITPSEMKKAAPGFELSLVFITLVISSVFASRKRRNR